MKKNVFKLALALYAMFGFGSGNLQDSLGAKPVSENKMDISCLRADIIPPFIPVNPKISTSVDTDEKA